MIGLEFRQGDVESELAGASIDAVADVTQEITGLCVKTACFQVD